MNLNELVATVETGAQDVILQELRLYNKEHSQCFYFEDENIETRKVLGTLLIQLLERDLQSPCQLACLETIRILSRDKGCLGPLVTLRSLQVLARHAGIDSSSSQSPDPEVMVEGLKCLCNLILSSPEGQQQSSEAGLVVGLARRLKFHRDGNFPHELQFMDLRLLFLLTALRMDIRQHLSQELHGITLMTDTLEAVLGVQWLNPYEVANEPSPLARQEVEQAMEILKVLFNITFNSSRQQADEEDIEAFRHLGALLRYCLMVKGDNEHRTEEFYGHTVNLLGNLPSPCLDVLMIPKVRSGCIEYMGVNLDAIHMLLNFLEQRLDQEATEKLTC